MAHTAKDGSTYQIRKGRSEDIPLCVELAHVELEEPKNEFLYALFRDGVASNSLRICEMNTEVVGFLLFQRQWLGPDHYVKLLAVSQRFQRMGIGRALIDYVFAFDTTEDRLWSSTEEPHLKSMNFHKKAGFEESGYIDNLPQNCREIIFMKRRHPNR